jgi:hypothetical protein
MSRHISTTRYHLTELSPTLHNVIVNFSDLEKVLQMTDLIYDHLHTIGLGGKHFMVIFPKFEDLKVMSINYPEYLAVLLVYHILEITYRSLDCIYHPVFPFSSNDSGIKTDFLWSVFRLRKAYSELLISPNMGIQCIIIPELAWYLRILKSITIYAVKDFISVDATNGDKSYLTEIDQKFIKGIKPICFYEHEQLVYDTFPEIINVYKRVHFIQNNLPQIFS